MVTPFTNQGQEIDWDRLARQTDRQVAAGVDFLVPLGTTGETPCLTDEEKVRVLETVKARSQGLPVMVGVGTNSLSGTRHAIELLTPYAPDAFLVVTPYYNKPTQEGLYTYFSAVAALTDKPIVLYNVPGRTGVNLEAKTTLRLSRIPNIVGIKEASGRYSQIAEILAHRDEDFAVLSGNDDETLSLMATGADGVISVASNLDPDRMAAMVGALLREDMQTARTLHYELMPLFHACFVESNPIPAKVGMSLLDGSENSLRLPLTAAGEATSELMKNVLQQLELID